MNTVQFWVQLVLQLGFPSALAGYLVWHWTQREERADSRAEKAADYVRDRLADLVENNTVALQHNTVALERVKGQLDRIERDRPGSDPPHARPRRGDS